MGNEVSSAIDRTDGSISVESYGGMDKIINGLYLGNTEDAQDDEQLKRNNITHVLVIRDIDDHHKPNLTYKFVNLWDSPTVDIAAHFSECNDFIHEARHPKEGPTGNVLVHCYAGKSRSATIVIEYVMTITGLRYQGALDDVHQKRPEVNPNHGFKQQLQDFENSDKVVQERQRLIEKFGVPLPEHEALVECEQLLKSLTPRGTTDNPTASG